MRVTIFTHGGSALISRFAAAPAPTTGVSSSPVLQTVTRRRRRSSKALLTALSEA